MSVKPITRVQTGTNAALIATAQALYPMGAKVLDLTPGDNLGFWKRCVPIGLHLLPPGHDYRTARTHAGTWTDVVFDPPYVTKGGSKTSTIHEMNARYGMLHAEDTPMHQWHRQILPGLDAAHTLLRRRGLLWWKLQDYVTSGDNWWFTKMALPELEARGFRLVGAFILDGNPGPQPKHNVNGTIRRQRHARNAHSELLIARKR